MNDDLYNCRKCGHFRFLHNVPLLVPEPNYVYSQICDPQNDHGCDCEEFVPEDNLDYVEYLAEKKGLI